jgi:hypothetical protein
MPLFAFRADHLEFPCLHLYSINLLSTHLNGSPLGRQPSHSATQLPQETIPLAGSLKDNFFTQAQLAMVSARNVQTFNKEISDQVQHCLRIF